MSSFAAVVAAVGQDFRCGTAAGAGSLAGGWRSSLFRAAKAVLLLTPDQPPVIRSATLETTYEAGKDYEWRSASREIILTAGTRIPFKTTAELHPAPQAPHSYKACRDGKSSIPFGEGRYFHDLQCAASYPTKEKWNDRVPLPRRTRIWLGYGRN